MGTDGAAGNAKSPTKKCAPSTWNVKLVGAMDNVIGISTCVVADWGKLTAGVSYDDMNSWDVSGVTDMNRLFAGAAEFNLPLNGWNAAEVTDMNLMFKDASQFAQNLNDWDVAKVASMANMFQNTAPAGNPPTVLPSQFNAPLNAWNVSAVENAADMFNGATLFNQDLSAWDFGTNVAPKSGIVKLAPGDTSKFDDMFKGTTTMSNCNKKGIHNKFEAAPRSLLVVFDKATGAAAVPWPIGLTRTWCALRGDTREMHETKESHFAATELGVV